MVRPLRPLGDEIAKQSMGINLFKHKVMSFTIGSFLAGIGGGLMAVHLGTIDPALFKFAPYFQYLANCSIGRYGEYLRYCNLCHSHHCSHGSPKVLRWVYELWFLLLHQPYLV